MSAISKRPAGIPVEIQVNEPTDCLHTTFYKTEIVDGVFQYKIYHEASYPTYLPLGGRVELTMDTNVFGVDATLRITAFKILNYRQLTSVARWEGSSLVLSNFETVRITLEKYSVEPAP